MFLLTPVFPVEASVLDGFCQVVGLDLVAAIQVGDGT
jgi:hypothetical protein